MPLQPITSNSFFILYSIGIAGEEYSIGKNLLQLFFVNRFFEKFDCDNVEAFTLKNNIFITINSMGMDNDRCEMCRDVEEKLVNISNSLKCSSAEVS